MLFENSYFNYDSLFSENSSQILSFKRGCLAYPLLKEAHSLDLRDLNEN